MSKSTKTTEAKKLNIPNGAVRQIILRYKETKKGLKKISDEKKEFHIAFKESGDIREFIILLTPQGGIYKNQKHILSFKAVYGPNCEHVFPKNPPHLVFITSMYHPNVYNTGAICLDILSDPSKWMPAYGFDAVITSLMQLLEDPNDSSPANGDAGSVHAACMRRYTSATKEQQTLEFKDECLKDFVRNADALNATNEHTLAKYVEMFPILGKK